MPAALKEKLPEEKKIRLSTRMSYEFFRGFGMPLLLATIFAIPTGGASFLFLLPLSILAGIGYAAREYKDNKDLQEEESGLENKLLEHEQELIELREQGQVRITDIEKIHDENLSLEKELQIEFDERKLAKKLKTPVGKPGPKVK